MDIKIDVYTRCFNEIKLAPYVVQYWKKYAQHVWVFDNESTDGSAEYLSQFDFITVITYNSNNCMDDMYGEFLRNYWYKKYRSKYRDFVFISDFDEIIYSEDINKVLKYMKVNNYTYCTPYNYTIHSKKFPKINNNSLLHESKLCRFELCNDEFTHKSVIWNPNLIKSMNQDGGGHTSNPTGYIINEYTNEPIKIFLFHACFIDSDWVVEKMMRNKNRLSQRMIDNNFCSHYNIDKDEYKKQLDEFINNKCGLKISDIITK